MKNKIGESGLNNHLNEIVKFERRNIGLHGRICFGDPEIGILGSDYFDRNGHERYYLKTPIDEWHGVRKEISCLRRYEKMPFHNRGHIPLEDGDFIIIFDNHWTSPPPLLGPYHYQVHFSSIHRR